MQQKKTHPKKEVMDFGHGKNHPNDDRMAHKCNQCGYTSSQAGHLRTHLKIHSAEKSNKCNQCEYASSWVSHLRRHLKTHSGEKSYKCNQCDYASSQASKLRTYLKSLANEAIPLFATPIPPRP